MALFGSCAAVAAAQSLQITAPANAEPVSIGNEVLLQNGSVYTYTLKGTLPKIVELHYPQGSAWLLLSPERSLQVVLGKDSMAYTGSAQTENQLLNYLKHNEDFLFNHSHNLYLNWSADSVDSELAPQIKAGLDIRISWIYKAPIPGKLKALIAAEIKYDYAAAFERFIIDWLKQRKDAGMDALALDQFNAQLHEQETGLFGEPTRREALESRSAALWKQREEGDSK